MLKKSRKKVLRTIKVNPHWGITIRITGHNVALSPSFLCTIGYYLSPRTHSIYRSEAKPRAILCVRGQIIAYSAQEAGR